MSAARPVGLGIGRVGAAIVAPAVAAVGGVVFVLLAAKFSPVQALVLMCGLVGVWALVRDPTLGLLLTAAVIPLERMGRLTNDSSMYTISLMRLVGVTALAALVVHQLVRRGRFRLDLPFFLYATYAGLALLSIFYASDLSNTVRACGAILANLMFFFLVTNLAQNRRHAEVAIGVWLAVSVLAGVYTTYDWHYGSGSEAAEVDFDPGLGEQETEQRLNTVWTDESEWENTPSVRRAMGPTSHSAVYGINLILTFPFFAYYFRFARSWIHSAVLMGGIAVIGYNLFLTNTRAAILIGAIAVGLCVVRGLIRMSVPRLVVGTALAGSLVFFIPGDVYTRILDLTNYTPSQSATLRIRLDYWSAAVRIIRDNFVMGVGVGDQLTVPRYIRIEGPEKTSVHNEFLMTFIELGVFGWLTFFGFVGLIYSYAVRGAASFRHHADTEREYWLLVACQIAMVSVLVYGMTVDVFHFPLKGWWLVAALTTVLFRLSQRVDGPEGVAA